jgi:hypothetical protein
VLSRDSLSLEADERKGGSRLIFVNRIRQALFKILNWLGIHETGLLVALARDGRLVQPGPYCVPSSQVGFSREEGWGRVTAKVIESAKYTSAKWLSESPKRSKVKCQLCLSAQSE